MSKAKQINGVEPVPRYIMPDRSAPDYERIIRELQNCGYSPIGSSYYYIKADSGWRSLCRIIHGGGKVFFHEVIDHKKYSISDKDIDEVVRPEMEISSLQGHYQISPDIEIKLSTLTNIL
ncbi:MAG: hypothetical protein ABSE07_01790 [Methanoregula sp.]|jgi:hypothetical protein